MRLIAVAAVLALGGCSADTALLSDQGDIRARWEAQNIYPNNYKGDLLAYLRTYLNNPDHVRSTGLAAPQLKKIGPADRYVACVRFDARNTDGVYKGVKEGAAVYVLARLDQFIDQPKVVREICKDADYAPFPELEALRR